MNPSELAQAAADAWIRRSDAVALAKSEGRDPVAAHVVASGVVLVVKKAPGARSAKIRLAGPGSPLGEILNVKGGKYDGGGPLETVARFSCDEILRWLVRSGVSIEVRSVPT